MSKIHLKNVRLSFPSLFKKAVFNGQEGKYEGTFLIDKKDEATKTKIDAAIKALLVDAKIKVASDKICLKDGDEVEYDGYSGNWSLKASNSNRFTIIDRDKTPLTNDDGILYAGCYVDAIVEFWAQNNNYGKRINANLLGVRFLKDGEPFGSGPIDVTEEFEDLDEDL